jgi:hypothetical protein
MIKRIIIALVLGGALFGGIWFFSNQESSEDSLKTALSDNYAAFRDLAEYMRANPKTVVIYSKDVKNDPTLKEDFDKISGTVLCVWNKSGAVAFDTGKETQSSDNHYIIYSPDGTPKDYPNAADAGKENWYIY